jgi:hypothetical protein
MQRLLVSGIVLAAAMGVCDRGAVAAGPVCGKTVQYAFADVKFHSRDYTATCRPGGACTIITHHLDDDAPLGFSHLFGFRRETADGRWQAVLVDETGEADTAASLSFRVDANAPAPVAANLVSQADGLPPAYYMDPGLTELVLSDAKPGSRIEWRYRNRQGDERVAPFSLIGLTDALEWSDCAQAELVSAKTDPAATDPEEPEYSGPEKGVPIDPDGRESGEPEE